MLKTLYLLIFVLILFGCSSSNNGVETNVTEEESTTPKDPNPENRLRILPLGDSITQGDASHTSYRYPLWKKLIDAGVDVDFVGSSSDNFLGNPEFPVYKKQIFDQDHEGHYGRRTDEILNQLPGWLVEYTVDIALIHLGTNDVVAGESADSTISELQQIVALLRSKNPTVQILLATPIPSSVEFLQKLPALQSKIDTLVVKLNHAASPVLHVDQSASFNPLTDTYDGIHPNASGEEKMAAKWFSAIVSLL